MANNFGGSDVVECFMFEPGSLTAGAKGTILTNVGGVQEETSDFIRGTGCARMGAIDQGFTANDSDLPAGFPCKSGSSNQRITIAFWFKTSGVSQNPAMFMKRNSGFSGNKIYWVSNVNLDAYFGSSATRSVFSSLSYNVWYHFAFAFDMVTGLFWGRLQNLSTGSVSTRYGKAKAGAIWAANSEPLYIGYDPNPNYYWAGLLDEYVIFNRCLSMSEMDDIAENTYGSGTESRRNRSVYLGNNAVAAMYPFDSSYTLREDAVGNNHLLAGSDQITGPAIAQEKVDYKSGTGCVRFKSKKSLSRSDYSLSDNFPFLGNNSNPKLSVAFWFKSDSVSGEHNILGKHQRATAADPEYYYYGWRIWTSGTDLKFDMQYGTCNQSTESKTLFSSLQAGQWYHLSFTYDKDTKIYYAELWDDAGQTLAAVGPLTTTNAANYYHAHFYVGDTSSSLGAYSGLMDQLAIFNDIIDSSQMASIRAGAYDFQSDASCVSLLSFDPGANFLHDSKGTNHLYQMGSPSSGSPWRRMEGTGLLFTGNDSADYKDFRLYEEDMDSKFPWKSDGRHDEMSVAFWWMPFVFPTMDGYHRYIMGKGDIYSNARAVSWWLRIIRVNPNDTIQIATGYNNGANLEYHTVYTASGNLPLSRWYFVGLSFNRTTKAYKFYLYDAVADQVVAQVEGVLTNTPSLTNKPFWIGNAVTQDSSDNYASHTANCYIDELSIWNKALSLGEFGLLKAGAIPPPTEVRQARADISGNARHLADNGSLQTGDVQGKIGNAAYFSGAGQQLLRLEEAPDLTGDQEFTIAFRMKPNLKTDPAADTYWHLKIGDLEIRAGFAPSQIKAFVSASTPSLSCRTGDMIPVDTFSFIAIYFDTSGLYIDVNDSNEALQAGAHTGIIMQATGIEAGISAAVAMNISIDELGLWIGINALSAAQRTTLYSGNYGQRPSFN
jgi:hypothetical protein